jgi:CheY-like chemotaxis protein
LSKSYQSIVILIADDDPEDSDLAVEALRESRLRNDVRVVSDGEELMEYLRQSGRYTPETAPKPGLILLDLNMPKMDGREALAQIKSEPELRTIPIVVLTTSQAEEDVYRSYGLGANSYITKPVTFAGLTKVTQCLVDYWFNIVTLPNETQA